MMVSEGKVKDLDGPDEENIHDQLPSVEDISDAITTGPTSSPNPTNVIQQEWVSVQAKNNMAVSERSLKDLDVPDEENLHDQLPTVEEIRASTTTGLTSSPTPTNVVQHECVSIQPKNNMIVSERSLKDLYVPDEENIHDQLPSVEEIRAATSAQGTSHNSGSCCRMGRTGEIALITLVAVLLVTIIGLSASYGTKVNPVPASASAPAPTLAPVQREPRVDEVTDFLVNNNVSEQADIITEGTPQNWAVHWLADQDTLNVPIPETLEGPEGMRFVSRYVGALFYYALDGSNWPRQLSFLSEKEICDWNEIFVADEQVEGRFFRVGIACNNGFVNTLQLPGNRLEGTIPPEIKFLSDLQVIALNSNKVEGTIPEGFQGMTNLDYLALQSNKLQGSLPTWMANLPDLRVLGLGDNNLDGTLPETLGQLSNLITLGLDNNKFTGGIVTLQTMVGLRRVYLENNDFASNLDGVFTEMKNLDELDLSSNRFYGTIPESLLRHSTLRILDLHENELDGPMPKVIPFNPALTYFSVYNNLITGQLPSSILYLDNLTHLDLSANRFDGTIPELIYEMTHLKYLFLSENSQLTPGPIPAWIGNLTHLEDLSLRNTARTGDIPSTLGLLKNLTLLDLYNNGLTGPIPRQLGELSSLRYLLLSKNQLTGTIPIDFELMTSLDLLLLDDNDLTGDADGMCTKGIFPSVFKADCEGTNPEITCECCSKCCLDTDEACSTVEEMANLDPVWENSFQREFYDFGPEMIFENR